MQQRMQVAAAVIIRGEGEATEIFSARRTEPEFLRGGWEFPGGKVDPGETASEAVHREIMEELGVTIELVHHLVGPLDNGAWPMSDEYALNTWIARITEGVPQLLEQHDAHSWLPITNAEIVPWLPVDLPVLRAAIAWVRSQA